MTLTPSGYEDTFARDHLPPADLWPVLEFTTPELQYPDRLNAAVELIDRAVERFGADRPALRTPAGETWTYGELQARTHQVARVLTGELGLRSGNRVLLRAPNNPWTVATWLGVLKAGGIPVTTFAALRAREIAPLVERTRPVLALVDHRYADDVVAAAPDLALVPVGGPTADDLVARAARQSTDDPGAVATAADDVALFCPTSGSTGVPKVTTHFHRDLLSIDHTFGRHVLQLRPDDVVACSAPFAFTFGLGMLVVFPLRAGACALLTEAATPLELAEIVAREGVTVLATAPTAYRRILGAGRIGDLAGLRVAVSAGEHLPVQTWEHVRDELGLEIIDGIGGTEFLHIYLSAPVGEIHPGTTGRAVPGFRATVLGPDGEELPPGEPGRLAVIGPVGCRYLDDARQAAYVCNGWNVTGDTFVRDAEGYFTYQTRTDNMIVSAGYNIGGPEVEAALDEHPDVAESAVVAAPDAERGSVVCAFVVLQPGVTADDDTARRLQDHVKQTLAPYKYPRLIRFIDALPRNTSGKLQHFQLRRTIEEEAPV
ncbi:AMP-binding protein [Pimelobacter simplex]|uniref:AMP-binding protein n=1 Tax=Nocardioides simplex TaxID=2045 RepID=UPI00214F76D2|nr:AMP-binding protein [Pimelobacter simplex]UUW87248.1 AMP-binding protein [Pimelobacter simplex]UUW96754.1 AMP-binding protein [Pimelobacter simplex]